MNPRSLTCVIASLFAATGCVDASNLKEDVEADAGLSPRDCFPDLSGLPSRGGPAAEALDEGLEPGTDMTVGIEAVLAVTDASQVADGVAPTNNFRRLTHIEYDRSVSDLLGIEAGEPSRDFPQELPTLDGFFALGSLSLSDRLIGAVQTSAEALTAQFVEDDAAFETAVGCSVEAADCKDDFIADFGLRAYRRPLTDTEVDRYAALFDEGAASNTSDSEFRDGVQIVVEAMLQSPHFLYRVERGSGESDELGERLTGYEAATRLSYMLWGSIPDRELLEAAGAGDLSTPAQVAVQAGRLLDDPAVMTRIGDYHANWLQLDSLVATTKDAQLYPEFSQDLVASMRAETERFIQETTLVDNGGFQALLTAPHGFVDARLASVYGLEGEFGDTLERVDFGADSPRGGLLTQAAFLTGHSSSSVKTSPILRGIFVLRRLLCDTTIGEPPPNAANTFPEASQVPLVTTRDFIEWQTGTGACPACHSVINPFGFAFEGFDAIGQVRTQEGGAAIDATAQLALQGGSVSVEGAKALAALVAADPTAQACYARNWLRYLWGRGDTEDDLRTLATLSQGLASPDYGIRDLLLDVTQSAAFLRRRATGATD